MSSNCRLVSRLLLKFVEGKRCRNFYCIAEAYTHAELLVCQSSASWSPKRAKQSLVFNFIFVCKYFLLIFPLPVLSETLIFASWCSAQAEEEEVMRHRGILQWRQSSNFRLSQYHWTSWALCAKRSTPFDCRLAQTYTDDIKMSSILASYRFCSKLNNDTYLHTDTNSFFIVYLKYMRNVNEKKATGKMVKLSRPTDRKTIRKCFFPA